MHPRDVLLASLRQLLLDDGAVIAHCQEVWGMKLSYVPIAQVRDQALLQSGKFLASRVVERLVRAADLERALAARANRLS